MMSKTTNKFSPEVRERAVRLVLHIAVGGKAGGASKQKGRPFGAASVNDVMSQLELDAGAGFEPAAFRL